MSQQFILNKSLHFVLIKKKCIYGISSKINKEAEDMKTWNPIGERTIYQKLIEDAKMSEGLSNVEIVIDSICSNSDSIAGCAKMNDRKL